MAGQGNSTAIARRAVQRGALAIALGSLCAGPAPANPVGGQVVGGQATIANTAPNTLTIEQATPKAAIDWKSFNIAPNETTQFIQPSASAVALNRVQAGDPSVIAGRLTANGQIILVNPSGVLFTKGSQVNVNSLLATPTDISTADFMAGRTDFNIPSSDPNARVVNNGHITVAEKGLAALVAPGVANNGIIAARLGKVVLAGATTYTLDFYGDGLMKFDIGAAAAGTVSNAGKILAPGGTVLLTADAVSGVLDHVVDMPGTISAPTYAQTPGSVTIDAGGGAAEIGGRINVSGLRPGQTGGTAAVTGRAVDLAGTARIDARGSAGGGSVRAAAGAGGTTITAGATIDTSATRNGNGGDVTVLADGTTSFAGTILANGGPGAGNGGDIETSGGQLVLGPAATASAAAPKGQAGTWLLDPTNLTIDATAATTIDAALNGGTNVTEMTTATAASGSGTQSAGNGDITVASALSWSSTAALTLSAFNNITVDAPITVSGGGTLVLTYNNDQGGTNTAGALSFVMGQGSAVFSTEADSPKLFINNGTPASGNGTGYTLIYNTGTGADGLKGINGTGGAFALANELDATGLTTADGSAIVPTLVGTLNGLGHTVSNLTINSGTFGANVGLFGAINSGALVANLGMVGGSITGASSASVGGLVGFNDGTIINSYVTGAVTGGDVSIIGGLVGLNNGTISDAYATGAVNGGAVSDVGGLVGVNSGAITDAYATGAVSDGGNVTNIGGLVAVNEGSGTITNVYAAGAVSGGGSPSDLGGLVGTNSASIVDAYFVADRSAVGTQTVGVNSGTLTSVAALSGTHPFTASNCTGFAFATTPNTTPATTPNEWVIVDTDGTLNNAAGASGATLPMLASEYQTTIQNAHQLQLVEMNLSGNYTLGRSIDASATSSSTSPSTGTDVWDSTGWVPIGIGTAYTGTFNGAGNTISGLTVYAAASGAGLFDLIGTTGAIENVGLVGGSITDTVAFASVGDLAAVNQGAITNTYATGSVSGVNGGFGGGLVGSNDGSITNSFAAGGVNGSGSDLGGLAGTNQGTITRSFAAGPVTSSNGGKTGGLVGLNQDIITDAYAVGVVTGTTGGAVGGLVAESLGAITDAYATGVVTGGGGAQVGGLVAVNGSTVVDGYWDTGTTGQPISAGGTPMKTAQLQVALPNFADPNNWGIIAGKSYPYLCWQFGNCAAVIPQVVSGTVFADQGITPASPGPNVFGLVNGTSLASVQTGGTVGLGANGYYYYLLAPNTLPSGGNVLTYEFGSLGPSGNGAALADQVSGAATGLNIFAGTLHEITPSTTSLVVASHLATALGGNSLPAGLVNLQVDASGPYGVNSALTYGSGTVTLNAQGAVTQTNIGLITANTLAGSSVGGATLTAVNSFDNFGPWTDTGTGSPGINVVSSVSLDVGGAVSSTGPVSITSSNIGDPDLTLSTNISGTTVILFANGAIDQTAGAITATTGLVATTQLDGGGAISLASAMNNVAGNVTLTSVDTAGAALDAGAISFTDTAGFVIQSLGGLQTGVATKGTATLVSSGGSIAQVSGSGTVTASTLSGSTAGDASFGGGNTVANLGPFSTTTGGNNGVLTFGDSIALNVGGTLSTGSGSILLGTAPALTVSAPVLSTGPVSLFADTMSFGAQIGGSGVGTGQSSFVALQPITSARPISLGAGAASGLALTDTSLNEIRSPDIQIAALGAGPITFDGALTAAAAFGTDTTGGLRLITTASAEFSGAIALQGGLSVSGSTITQNAGSIVAGANSVISLAATGAITQTGGCCAITASTLTGSSGGATALDGANAIGAVNTFSAGGALSLNDTVALSTSGSILAGTGGSGDLSLTAASMNLTGNSTSWVVQTPGNMTLTTTSGDMTLGALERVAGTLTLSSAGQITENTGTGNIAAGALAGSSVGGTNLPSLSTPTLAAFSNTASGNLFLEDTLPTAITVTGTLSTPSGTTLNLLNFGPLALAATSSLSAPGATGIVTLGTTNGGTITQAAGSVITTGNLQGQSNGGVSLAGANQVAVLGPFGNLTSGDFTFDDAQSFAISGRVATPGTMTLSAGGAITEPSGSIAAGSLVATTELDGGAAITLNRSANTIPGNVTLTSLNSAGAAPDAGAITFFDSTGFTVATIDTTGSVTLQAGGPIAESGFGHLSAANLDARTLSDTGASIQLDTSITTVPGGVTLTAMNSTGTALAAGNIGFDNSVGYTIVRQPGGGVGGLETGIGTTSTAGLGTNGVVTEVADAVITSPMLTGTSVGGATLNGANMVGTLGPFGNQTSGDFSFTNAAALRANVSNLVGNVTLTTTGAGSTLTVAGIAATGNTVSLVSAATIDETGGTIVAATVTGSSAGGANLTGTNHVGTFGPFANGGGGLLAFTAAQALTTAGTVSSAGDLTLTTTSGNLNLGGNVTASSGTVTLASAGATSEPGGIIDPGSLLLTGGGPVSLPGANTVDTLAASITGVGSSLVFNDTANNLTIGTVGGVSGVTTSNGAVTLTTTTSGGISLAEPVNAGTAAATIAASGNLAIGASGSVTAGAGATLATLGNFSNAAGAGAISVGAGNRWLVYSTDPTLDTDGGLTPAFIQDAATYDIGTLTATTPAAAGNGFLYSLAPQITLSGITKPYDGTTNLPTGAAAYTSTGIVAGDTVTLDVSGVAGSYASADASPTIDVTLTNGPAIASATRGGVPIFGYTVGAVTSDPIGTITPAVLTATIIGNPTKIYDGGIAATLTSANYSLSGFVAGQGVSVAQTAGTYASANAGTGIAVSTSLTAADFSATGATLLSNYTLPISATGTGTITPAPLTAMIIGNPTKIYDGGTAATLTSANYSLSGFIAGQGASVAQTAGTYASANAGTGIAVSTSLTAADFSATGATLLSNYTLPISATGTGTITPATLTYTANAASQTYGGATPALSGTVTGFVPGQTQATATTGALAFTTPATSTSNVGTYAINGSGLTADNGDYVFVEAGGNATAFSVLPAALTVTPNAVSAVFTGVALNNAAYSDNTANYTVVGLQNGQSLVTAGIVLTGSMAFNGSTATAVESPGPYTQGAGTLALTSTNNNYALSFTNPVPHDYVITAPPPTTSTPTPTPTAEPTIPVVEPQPVAAYEALSGSLPLGGIFCLPIDDPTDPTSKYRCMVPQYGLGTAAAAH